MELHPDDIPPDASALIESMRDIGYTLESALADVIDNSITAGAKNVRILVTPGLEDPRIAVVDDGAGMSSAELRQAMKPGSSNPRSDRHPDDLGRFGLGMKTASFSQCRKMTVVSRRSDETSAASWDLGLVARLNAWRVTFPDPREVPFVEELGESGTLVVWENLDRLVDDEHSEESRAYLTRRIDEARRHLELVFHRFLSPEKGGRRVKIELNGAPLKAFDPFHSAHGATQHGIEEVIHVGGSDIRVKPFTLPHHDKVSHQDWEHYATTTGYVRSQGFYVYRANRLIIYGTWFGLARQAELTKLARVRIDLPNELDAEWKVDVLKSSAQPPRLVRQRLARLLEPIVGASKRTYKKREVRLTSENPVPVWERTLSGSAISYRISSDHPSIVALAARLAEDELADFRRVLEIVSASVPAEAIAADLSATPHEFRSPAAHDDTMRYATETLFTHLRSAGMGIDGIRATCRATEPYRSSLELCERVLDELMQNEETE